MTFVCEIGLDWRGVTDEKGEVREKGGSGPSDLPPPSGHAYELEGQMLRSHKFSQNGIPVITQGNINQFLLGWKCYRTEYVRKFLI